MMVAGESLFPADEPFSSPPQKADGPFADFCVARFSRTDLSMIGARALKSARLPTGDMPPTYETMPNL
jgi:hypothetical protein